MHNSHNYGWIDHITLRDGEPVGEEMKQAEIGNILKIGVSRPAGTVVCHAWELETTGSRTAHAQFFSRTI